MDKGATMSTIDKQHALIYAATYGRIENVKKYLNDKTVNVNWKPEGPGAFALFEACFHGHLEIVELLLNNGADIEVKTDRGETPLLKACRQGHLSITKLLLDGGANIVDYNEEDWNPLHEACSRGNYLLSSY